MVFDLVKYGGNEVKPFKVLVNNDIMQIVFESKVNAIEFFEFGFEIENGLEKLKSEKVLIDLTKTIYFDTLALCYLFMFLKKSHIKNHTIFQFLLIQGEELTEHKKKFVNFLRSTGFYSYLEDLNSNGGLSIEKNDFPTNKYSDIHSCIYRFNILMDKKEIDLEIQTFENELTHYLKDRIESNPISYIIHKVAFFLHEALENVFNHAFKESEEIKMCSIIANIVKSEISLDTREYEKNYTSKTPYLNISLFQEKNEYIEIYIADLGMGLRKSFLMNNELQDPKITDENILEYILTEGQRSHTKLRNADSTEYGGLYNLTNTFYADGDRLGFKADSRWLFGKDQKLRINKQIPQHEYSCYVSGFAIVGFISWKYSLEELTSGYFFSDKYKKNSSAQLYWEKNYYMNTGYAGKIKIVDKRFSKLPEKRSYDYSWLVMFPSENLKKDEIVKSVFEYKIPTVMIVDISETELKNYYMIFKSSKQRFTFIEKLILISRTNAVAIFCQGKKENGLIPNDDEAKLFSEGKFLSQNTIEKSLINFRLWQKTYDSEVLWNLVSHYNKFAYINAEINWMGNILRGYLDFSQVCLIPECRDLCIQRLFHLRSNIKPIYFRSLDRFTEDICAQANRIMDNSPDDAIIWIGSVFVSGTSEHFGRDHDEEIEKYYFFQHADSIEKVSHLFEWSTLKERLNEWFPADKYSKKKYERVGKTSFLANDGANFWLKKHYQNSDSVFSLSQKNAYDLFQHSHTDSSVLEIMHFDILDHHDLFHINTVTLFENDMNRNKALKSLKDNENCYDFLLTKFFSALRVCSKPYKCKSDSLIDEQINPLLKDATKEKLDKFYNRDPDKKNEHGLIIYFADYETSRIAEYFRELLNDELKKYVVPVIPIGKNYFSEMLNLSPLLLERLEDKIKEIKNINLREVGEEIATITIFISTILSAQLGKQLKHIMYRLGATKVCSISIVDRQRFPLGTYSETKNHAAYIRLDSPELGGESDCYICKSLEQISLFVKNLQTTGLIDRMNDILGIWKSVRTSDKHIGVGIKMSEIRLPESIKKKIQGYSKVSKLDSVDITSDFGLALYCVENSVITLSNDLLQFCLDCDELGEERKVFLLAIYILLSNKLQISEKNLLDLHYLLTDLINSCENTTNITALACIAIFAQNKYYSKLLYKKVLAKNEFKIKNNDYLLLLLWLHQNHSERSTYLDAPLNCHYKNSCNKLEIIYNILLYTETDYKQSHYQAFSQILSVDAIDDDVYQKAKDYSIKLCSIYLDKLYAALFFEMSEYNLNKDTIIDKLMSFNKMVENKRYHEAKKQLEAAIKLAKEMNKRLFIRAGDKVDIKNWLNFCIKIAAKKANTSNKDICIKIGDYYKSDAGEGGRPWFYVFSDVTEEISNLISDIFIYGVNRLKDIFTKDSNSEDYQGLIKVEFKDEWVSVYFFNITSKDPSIGKINQRKISKSDRPSMLVFKDFQRKLSELNGEEQKCFIWEFVEGNFSELNLDSGHLLRAEIKIPYVDMGSSFNKKEQFL